MRQRQRQGPCLCHLPTRTFRVPMPQSPEESEGGPHRGYPFYLLSSLCFCLSIMTGFGGRWNFVGSPSPFIRHIEEENHPVKIKRSEKHRSQKAPFPTASQLKPPAAAAIVTTSTSGPPTAGGLTAFQAIVEWPLGRDSQGSQSSTPASP